MNQKVWFAEMCWFARLRAVVQSWMPSSVMKLWVRMRWETYHLYNPLEENDMWKHRFITISYAKPD